MAEKIKRPRLMVINEPDGRRFSRALALEIGRDHAEMFLQIEYLISISDTPMLDGKLWTRQSIRSLQEEHFPYWGRTFISELISDLCNGYDHIAYTIEGEGRGQRRTGRKVQIPPLLVRGHHDKYSTINWLALNEEGIQTLSSVRLDEQAKAAVSAKRTPVSARRTRYTANRTPVSGSADTYIPEIPTETPTEGEGANSAAPRTPASGGSNRTTQTPEPPPNFTPDWADLLPVDQEAFKDSNIVAIRTNSKVKPSVAALLNRRRKGS